MGEIKGKVTVIEVQRSTSPILGVSVGTEDRKKVSSIGEESSLG